LIGIDGYFVCLEIVLTNSLSKFKHTQTVRIMGMSVVQSLAGGFLDAPGCVEIRLAHFQMDDVNTLTLHFVGFLKNVHNDKRCHFFGSI
jgi:hypothetical protein